MYKLFTLFLIIILSACAKHKNQYDGYIDTDLVYLSADYSGRLMELAVDKGQLVKTDQFLFKIEQTPQRNSVRMSQLTQKDLQKQRQQTLVQLQYNEINYQRTLGMRKQNAASQNDVDLARRDLDTSREQLAEIDVKLKNNKVDTSDKTWQMTRKEGFAPELGLIFDTYYKRGEFVPAGYPVVSLIMKTNLKAVFFVPESQLHCIRLNGRVQISTDASPHFAQGRIFYISKIAEYTPPIIYSRDERQRLVFRVEAKIDAPDLEKIHLGQPVTLERLA